MLRAYIAPYQTDWDEHLVAAEFAYNNSVQASNGFTPFYLNHGRHTHTPLSLNLANLQPSSTDNNLAAIDFVGRFQSSKTRSTQSTRQTEKYADQNRRGAEFAEGDMVLLSTQNLTRKIGENTTTKFCPKHIGPFKISKVLSPMAYQLQLPNTMKCHNVFHISLLKRLKKISRCFPHSNSNHRRHPCTLKVVKRFIIVDYIMGHEPKTAKSHEDTKKYLIKWEGYPLWEATKEPAKNSYKDDPQVVQQQSAAPTAQQPVPSSSSSFPLQ
eukprot:scaffold90369_cov20-Tisochrysis_lutea.AAC.1